MIYETTVSTIQDSAEAAARRSGAQLQQERPRYPAESPPGRAQTPHARLIHRRMAAQMPQRLRFNRTARLKQGRDFARLRQGGERLANGCLIANWQRLPPGAVSRLGVVTSRRIGGAVVRSRARRLLRESFRVHQHHLAVPVDLVLVARPSIVQRRFTEVERDFLAALRRARLLRPAGGEDQ